jgi:N-succinyldiaminopimelate aminotransferase
VVAIPSSVFYDGRDGDHLVRFAFCKRPSVLSEAVRRLGATTEPTARSQRSQRSE